MHTKMAHLVGLNQTTPVDKGGRGAWQVGVRMSEFDASDITVATGKTNRATAMTYGITWFCNRQSTFYAELCRHKV
jgi:phosphate-selective porin